MLDITRQQDNTCTVADTIHSKEHIGFFMGLKIIHVATVGSNLNDSLDMCDITNGHNLQFASTYQIQKKGMESSAKSNR